MKGMRYLTVQDMLWINARLAGCPKAFDFSKLEEATYCQYGYGQSSELSAQAARFLNSFHHKPPFESANRASAFVGFAVFLWLNGKRLALSDSEAGTLLGGNAAAEGVSKAMEDCIHSGSASLNEAVAMILEGFPNTIAAEDA